MAIKIKRDDRANAVVFQGSTFPTYWNGLLTASLHSGSATRIDIENTSATTGSKIGYEYYNYPISAFEKADGSTFSSSLETIDYINDLANQHSPLAGFQTIETLNNTTADFTASLATPVTLSFSGSSDNFNTFVEGDIVEIYNTSSYVFNFQDLTREDFIDLEVNYQVNSDVADAAHEIELRFVDNTGTQYSKTVTQTQVDSADEDVDFITTIPFYIGDNLILNGSDSGSAQLFFTPDEDATIKVKNFTIYLNR